MPHASTIGALPLIACGMQTVLIVFHSMTGGTRQMAEAAAVGARSEPTIRVRLMHAADAAAADVLEASAYLFASPENLGAMSGLMKDFFDRTYYPALDRINGRPYGVLICAGSDGRNAAEQIQRIATGWRLRAIFAPFIVCTHAQRTEDILAPKRIGAHELQQCTDLGATVAAGCAFGIF